MTFQVTVDQGVPKFLSGILCPASTFSSVTQHLGVGVGGIDGVVFIVVSCVLVSLLTRK